MQMSSISSLISGLKESSSSRDLQSGKKLHTDAVKSGFISDIYVATSLVNMYAKCGSMVEARKIFDRMQSHSLVSWTALMLGYAQNGQAQLALDIFALMKTKGFQPDRSSFLAALKACSCLVDEEGDRKVVIEKGMQIHVEAAKQGLDSDLIVASSLVDMYVKCGSLVDAHQLFERIPFKNVVSWTTLMSGFVFNGECELALMLFSRMLLEGCRPSDRSFVAALKACSGLATRKKGSALRKGFSVHSLAAESGCDAVLFVGSSLVDMYVKCGSLVDARQVFEMIPRKNVVSWTSLILGHAQSEEEADLALELFARMQLEGCLPDAQTFVAALQACSSLAAKEESSSSRKTFLLLEIGMRIHSQALRDGFDYSDAFLASSLIDMYAKCGVMIQAREVFDRIMLPDVVASTALILGYVQNGGSEQALEVFEAVQLSANARTFVAAIKACITLAAVSAGEKERLQALETGMAVHSQAVRRGFDSDIGLTGSLVEMYSKCGSFEDARRTFSRVERHTVVSWNALLMAYVQDGEAGEALRLFACMQLVEGCSADVQTFVVTLKACVELGALQTGRRIHREISSAMVFWRKEAAILAVNCLVDFYCKCGSIAEAQEVFDSAAFKDVVTWTSLIAGYGRRGEAEGAFRLFGKMRDEGLQPNSVTMLGVLTACSHAGMISEAREFLDEMSSRYGTVAAIEHYHCVIDMLGRANRISEALAMVRRMPFEPSSVTWTCLLDACYKWKNLEIGKLAFQELLEMDPKQAAAYDLMANIFGSFDNSSSSSSQKKTRCMSSWKTSGSKISLVRK